MQQPCSKHLADRGRRRQPRVIIEENTFLTVYILAVAAVFGAVFGSFINCMAWRIAHDESVMKGRSHCAVCGHPLGAADLIPIFSYLFLRGRCRYCREKISPRYMAVEVIMAAAFVLGVWRFDVSLQALWVIGLACILMVLSLVDLETYLIPDRFIIAGIIWYFGVFTFAEDGKGQLLAGLAGGFSIGIAMLLLSLLFDKVTGKESLGGGDIKLFFMTGLYLGPWVGLFNLILACIIGIGFVLFMGQKRIPFGPAISLATFVSLLVGSDVVNWYLGLFY